ncbi:MAG: glutathione binding-like protein, partial [Rhodospirillaceae bacterium]
EAQVRGAFGLLDARAAGCVFLTGERLTQADISAVCAFDFAAAVLPDQLSPAASWPQLAALSDRVNAIEAVGKTKPTA